MEATTAVPTKPIGPHHDEGRWLEERSRRLTGSKIAAIFGEHPYVSAADVQQEALQGPQETEETPIMRRGRLLEPIAVQEYEERTGRVTRRQPLRVWKDDDLFAATVDRQILAGAENPTAALEVKVPGWQVFSRIRREGLLPYMVFQGQLEALVYGYDFTSFAVLHADSFRLLTFDLEADPDFQGAMIERARQWWHRHVVNREPVEDAQPPEDLPEVSGEIVQREDALFTEAATDLLEARDIRKEAEAIERDAKQKLKGVLGEFGTYEGGGARIYYSPRAGRKSRDWNALAKVGALDPAKVQGFIVEHFGPGNLELLRDAADGLRLDLAAFEREGRPYEVLTPYRVRVDEGA